MKILTTLSLLFACLFTFGQGKLTGTAIGTPSALTGAGEEVETLFDGDYDTGFDTGASAKNEAWGGLDFGEGVSKKITSIKFGLRVPGNLANIGLMGERLSGAKIYGSNDVTFDATGTTNDVTVADMEANFLCEITDNDVSGMDIRELREITVTNNTDKGYRYALIFFSTGSFGNCSELEFYGQDDVQYSFNVTAQNGSVTRNPNAETYSENSVVELTAVPDAGYSFDSWSGDITATANPASITITNNANVEAVFKQDVRQFSFNITATNGSVTRSPNANSYLINSVVGLTATPNAGYRFVSWSGDVTGTDNTTSYTISENANITAVFERVYSFNITAQNGSVTINPNADTYLVNTAVELTAVPEAGYRFVSWAEDVTVTNNPASFTITNDANITAVFEEIPPQYSFNITAENGSVTRTPNAVSYLGSSVVELTAVPSTDYRFVSWSGDVTGTNNPASLTITKDVNITAVFEEIPQYYSFNITADNGSVSANPDAASYLKNTTIAFTATPNAGYRFVSWSGDATGTNNPVSLTATSNANITAVFEKIPEYYSFNITAENGSVTTNPDTDTFMEGLTIQLTATPIEGYRFVAWTGDVTVTDNPVAVIASKDMNITATFESTTSVENFKQDVISFSPNPNSGIFTIRMNNDEEATYTVYTPAGREVQYGTFAGETTVDLNKNLKGLFIVKVNSNNKISVHKVIVQP